MNPILLLNTDVEMQATLGTPVAITGISKANPGIMQATAHGLAVGDLAVVDEVLGMTEMNKRVVRVAQGSPDEANSLILEGLDTSEFTAYVSGGTITKIATFHSFDNATSFNYPEPAPNRLDVTTIHDTAKKEVFGLDEAPQITMNTLAAPTSTTVAAIKAASLAKTTRVFRVTLQDGTVLIFNAYVAGGRGLDGTVGAVATGNVALSLAAPEQYFAAA